MKYWLHDKKVNLIADLKRIHKSWTMLFNGLSSGISAFILLLPIDQAIAIMPQLEPYIASDTFRTAMQVLIIVNGINMALRMKTTKALRDK